MIRRMEVNRLEESLEEKKARCARTYAAVDLDAILSNMQSMHAHVAEGTRMIAVIKTDGYGHGAIPIARMLEPYDFMYGFAVATVEEAELLRESGVKRPILILGYTFPYCYETLAREEIRPAIFREDSIEVLSKAARSVGKKMKVHVKVDTGMGRIGVRPDEEGLSFVKKVLATPELILEGIFTHFARADEADKTAARIQLERFQSFLAMIEQETGYSIPVRHCSNSAGILELPEANMDVVRAGITLYGLAPSAEVDMHVIPLRPALSWYSTIAYVKELRPGESVSYGGLFTAEHSMRVATIPVGYGDGYPRSLTNKGYVLIRGKQAPILGRVCMDQMMVDVTAIPGATCGDQVTLLGTDGAECISAEALGELSGRFNYELVCDIGKRVPRVYLQGGEVTHVQDMLENV